MTVRSRLLLAFAAVTVILSLPGLYGLERLHELRRLAAEQRSRHASAWIALGSMRTAITEFDKSQRSFVAAPGPGARAEMHGALRDASRALDQLRAAGYGPRADSTARLVAGLEASTRRIEGLVDAGRFQEATDVFASVKPTIDRARASLAPVAVAVDRNSARTGRRTREISEAASATLMLALLGTLLLALLVSLALASSLTDPVRRLRTAVARVAEGHLEAPDDLPYGRRDEVGELSRSFRSMTEKLDELNQLRAEFVGIATHKLKTPLNVVSGYVDLLEEELTDRADGPGHDVVRAIREQIDVLADDLGRLLDLSRVESGRVDVRLELFHLRDLVRAVRSGYGPDARRRDVQLEVEVAEDAPDIIVADEERLRTEVLGNLLDNAFKFARGGGRVVVRADREDGHLLLEVEDDGLGIPAEDLPHIFEKYYQSGRGARSLGTGLGLAIARQVVEAHGGTVDARSEPDRGALFRVRIPLSLRPGREPSDPGQDDEDGDRDQASGQRRASAR